MYTNTEFEDQLKQFFAEKFRELESTWPALSRTIANDVQYFSVDDLEVFCAAPEEWVLTLAEIQCFAKALGYLFSINFTGCGEIFEFTTP